MSREVLKSYLLGAVALIFVWEVFALAIQRPIVPEPAAVFVKLSQVFFDAIAVHAAWSLWRIAAGLFLAVGIGYPLGVVMGYFERTDKFLSPLVYLTYPVPKIALLPILMLLAGVGEVSKVLMMFLIIVFQVVIAVRDGIRTIPAEIYFPLYSLGANFRQVFCEIIFPATLPKFITAVRVAMATAISVLFFTETFGTQFGMGFYIMDAWLRVNYLEMYAGIVVLSFLGLFLFGLIDFIESKICNWQVRSV